MEGREDEVGVAETFDTDCVSCGDVTPHRVTFTMKRALSRDGITRDETGVAKRRYKILKCVGCGESKTLKPV
ncbi:hypothetical protein SAMN04488124_3117 [Halogeometricum limi]|uniref:Uncharacterized protein n=1 Tax=Halogeometricum limi TaxID=555875 RepID=A0A1I6IDX4_9EURY|nr:hypothetical protein SAMN04488124_3117 [Halogeometricum limi]